MTLSYQRRRLADVGAALAGARSFAERERWPHDRLARHQQERLEAIVAHAAARSPYYRERLGAGAPPEGLAALPAVDKREFTEHFDEIVCDPRLRREELLAHVEALTGDALHLGEYRVMTTSGSSGRKGLFVYDTAGWRAMVAQFLRFNAMAGIRPRLPRRLRIAAVFGASPVHMSRRISQTMDVGLHRVLALPATLPIPELVAQLNRFQPDSLNGYPSVLALLAQEQLAGRLRIGPTTASTSSELRTEQMRALIEEAFGVSPCDLYATTEGLWGAECEERAGVHLFEDVTLAEVVDERGDPVPDGRPGTRLLVTSLVNRVQPIIRLALDDAVTVDPDPCPCGRTLRRLRAVRGRTDDVLHLPGRDGRPVAVHPLQFALLTRDPGVVEFQVRQDGARVEVLVVSRAGAAAGLEQRLAGQLTGQLRAAGAADPTVTVRCVDRLERGAGGKLQLVVGDGSYAGAGRRSSSALMSSTPS